MQQRREVLGALERLDGDVDRRHALGCARGAREDVRRRALLESGGESEKEKVGRKRQDAGSRM